MLRFALVVLLAVLAWCTAGAQPAPAIGGPGFDKVLPGDADPDEAIAVPPVEIPVELKSAEGEKSADSSDGEDTRKLVETVMMVRLTEELQLDDEQTVVMVRRLRNLKAELGALRKSRGDLYRQVKDSVRDNAADADIQTRLNALIEHDRKLETFKQDRASELGEGLTTRQQAQLYIFLSEFEGDMRHLVHRAQERSGDWRQREGDWRGRDDSVAGRNDGSPPGQENVKDSSTGSKSSGKPSQ
jgi:hypothetical protein